MAYDIGPRITIAGEKEFNNQMKSINSELKELGSELKAVSSEFDKNGSSQEALIAKSKVMEKQLEAQRTKLSALQQQYDKESAKLKELAEAMQKAAQENGESSAEAAKAETAYRNQEQAVSKLTVSINETQSYINKLNNNLSENKTKLDEIEAGARDAATGLSKLDNAAESTGDNLEEMGKKLDAGNLMQAAENLQGVSDKLIEIGQSAMDSATEWDSAQVKMQANLGLTKEETEKLGAIAKNIFEQGIAGSVDTASEAVMLCKQNFEGLNDTDLGNLSSQLVGIAERTGTDLQENVRGANQVMTAFGISGQEALDLISAGYQANLNSSGDFMDTLNEYAPLFAEAGYSAQDMLSILSNGMDSGALNTDKVADAVKELQIRLGDGTFEQNMGLFSQSTQDMFAKWKEGGATVSDVAASIGQDLKQMTPTEQQQALSALSSQFEDLGIDASVALFDIGNEFSDVTGKAKEFSQATPSEAWQGSLNKISDSLADIGTKIMETLQPAIEFIAGLAEKFAGLPGIVQTVIVVVGILITTFVALAPAISAVMTIVSTLSTVALGPIIPIIAGVIAAITAVILIFQNWGAISEWLGGVVETVGNWLKETWESVKQWFIDGINSIIDWFKNLGQNISDTFNNIINNVKNWATNMIQNAINAGRSFVDNVINFFRQLPGNVANFLSSVISSVASWASNLINQGINAARGFVDNIANFFRQLPGMAWNWGMDMIQGFVDGIWSMVGSVINAAKSVAGKVRSFLHFSRPDEGPLRDYETWMPDMMKGLSKTLKASEWQLETPLESIANTIKAAITPDLAGSGGLVIDGGAIQVELNQPIVLDGQKIANNTQKYITKGQSARLRSKGVVR